MNAYLITYDLNDKGQKYTCIREKIEKAFPCWKCLNNIFIIKTLYNASQIKNYLSDCLDDNDSLIVVSLNSEFSSQGLNKEQSDSLKSILI